MKAKLRRYHEIEEVPSQEKDRNSEHEQDQPGVAHPVDVLLEGVHKRRRVLYVGQVREE